MPRRTLISSEANLKAITTPNHGGRYTVISHSLITDTIKAELQKNNMGIVKEMYRSTSDGQIATGTVWLTRSNDPDISMMVSWTNSYNKMVRFMSVVGGYVHANEAHVVGNNLSSFSRKHTGDADTQAVETIEAQIGKATAYFNNLVRDKDLMKQHVLTEQEQAELAGRIFIEFEHINKEQLGIVRDQINKCEFHYNSDANSMWAFYNHFNYALRFAHPKTWMVQQSEIHNFLMSYMNNSVSATTEQVIDTTTAVLDPNQLNLLEAIAEVENGSISNIAPSETPADYANEILENPTEQLAEAFQIYRENNDEPAEEEDDQVFDLDDLDFSSDTLDLSDL
jgi:hypothetical protein